jgi:hypothetical protein
VIMQELSSSLSVILSSARPPSEEGVREESKDSALIVH